jgi:hypothetical protein
MNIPSGVEGVLPGALFGLVGPSWAKSMRCMRTSTNWRYITPLDPHSSQEPGCDDDAGGTDAQTMSGAMIGMATQPLPLPATSSTEGGNHDPLSEPQSQNDSRASHKDVILLVRWLKRTFFGTNGPTKKAKACLPMGDQRPEA